MAINNHPITTDDPNINQMRYMIEQRAEWLYEICKELESRGIDYEPIARAAISRFGHRRGQEMLNSFCCKGHDLRELGESFESKPSTTVFEKEYIEISKDRMEVDFHYCPLLACWQKLTNDETALAKLCDMAMDGDRCMFSEIPDSEFILAQKLADGDPVCKMIVQKKNN